jgi:hypothetical protein
MHTDSSTTRRRQPRYLVKIPIVVSGVDSHGHHFSAPAETLNGSTQGMGLLLNQIPDASIPLLISIFHDQRIFQIQTEVCHVTSLNGQKTLVGVKFLGVHPN